MTFSSATEYCKDFKLDGKGWRIPARNELLTLYQYGISYGRDTDAFPEENWSEKYWSANNASSGIQWVVFFGEYGALTLQKRIQFIGNSIVNFVRCVRS